MTEEELSRAMRRPVLMNAAPKPSLERRMEWLEDAASEQRTAILKLEKIARLLFKSVCACGNFYDAGVGGADMTITTEEAERLAGIWWIQGRETMNRDLYAGTATALRSLAAERDALNAENARLWEALRDIARQKKTDELDTEYDVEVADFEGGYDSIIDIARVAVGEKE
jgi:hypothetical protein